MLSLAVVERAVNASYGSVMQRRVTFPSRMLSQSSAVKSSNKDDFRDSHPCAPRSPWLGSGTRWRGSLR